MKTPDITAQIRAILRDTDTAKLYYTDEQIAAAILRNLNKINAEFELFLKHYKVAAGAFLVFDKVISKIVKVTGANGDKFEFKRDTVAPLRVLDFQSVQNTTNEPLEVFVIEAITDIEVLPDFFDKLITLMCASDLFLCEANSANLERVQFYDALIKKEKDELKDITRNAFRHFVTRY